MKNRLNTAEQILKEQVNLEKRNTEQKKRGGNVLSLIELVGAKIILAEFLPFYNEDLFFNMNRVEGYNLLVKKINSVESFHN